MGNTQVKLEEKMRNSHVNYPLLRLLRNVVLLDVLIFMAVGAIYLIAGWRTIHQYGNALVWAGAIGMLLTLIGVGWRNNRREDNVALSQLMREDEVFYLLNRDLGIRANYLVVGFIALAITLTAGLLLTNLY